MYNVRLNYLSDLIPTKIHIYSLFGWSFPHNMKSWKQAT